MFAAGKFSYGIKSGSTVYPRTGVFSFQGSAPGTMTSFAPNITNGTGVAKVNSVALSSDCSIAYIGGLFTTINGVPAKNIAALNTSDGSLVAGFKMTASGQVNHIENVHGHLLVGGSFTGINNSTAHPYLVSLSPFTGKDDGYLNLPVSGKYTYTQQDGRSSGTNSTNVYNMTMSPDQGKVLIMGVFTSVGGQARRQIAMLDLGTDSASVDPFYSNEFNQNCYISEPFWLQDAAWSPDMSKVYVVATGYKPANDYDTASGVTTGYNTGDPRSGLCDAAAAFYTTDTSGTPVSVGQANGLDRAWVQYTGCDSFYATAADSTAVYVGGHQRWLNNPNQCDNNNDGSAVVDPGMGGLDPATGSAYTTSNPLVGEYQRSRGTGADDMVVVPGQGLWIGSDNGSRNAVSQTCGGKTGHAGICLLPY